MSTDNPLLFEVVDYPAEGVVVPKLDDRGVVPGHYRVLLEPDRAGDWYSVIIGRTFLSDEYIAEALAAGGGRLSPEKTDRLMRALFEVLEELGLDY